jgi:hypothetical protein
MCVALNDLVIGSDSGLLKVLHGICVWGLRKTSEPSVKMSGGSAEVRTEPISIVRRVTV